MYCYTRGPPQLPCVPVEVPLFLERPKEDEEEIAEWRQGLQHITFQHFGSVLTNAATHVQALATHLGIDVPLFARVEEKIEVRTAATTQHNTY